MEESDAALVERARGGCTDAFRVLVERHSGSLFRLAYHMTLNQFDADDVVQETFLRAYRNLGSFEGRSAFTTWLFRIAVNCSLDVHRGKGKTVEPTSPNNGDGVLASLATPDPGPDRVLLSSQLRRIVDQTLAGLSPLERTAFVLRHVDGMSVTEISAVLGSTDTATRHSIFRAVRKLRKTLRPMVGTRQ